jgi:Ni/Fe-hydrogenase subunit HybB-like protein
MGQARCEDADAKRRERYMFWLVVLVVLVVVAVSAVFAWWSSGRSKGRPGAVSAESQRWTDEGKGGYRGHGM